MQKWVATGNRWLRYRRLSANHFMRSFRSAVVESVKSFILLLTRILGCTIFVAARLLFRPGATLPRPPRFSFTSKPDADGASQ